MKRPWSAQIQSGLLVEGADTIDVCGGRHEVLDAGEFAGSELTGDADDIR
jgi:hypothetical protein